MHVEVLPVMAADIITKIDRETSLLQIRVNGKRVGFIGKQLGARATMVVKFKPAELKEIDLKVKQLLPEQITGFPVQASEIPRPLKRATPKYDDFD